MAIRDDKSVEWLVGCVGDDPLGVVVAVLEHSRCQAQLIRRLEKKIAIQAGVIRALVDLDGCSGGGAA